MQKLQLIEVAKLAGNPEDGRNSTHPSRAMISEARPIVFDSWQESAPTEDDHIDLPFTTCSFERLDGGPMAFYRASDVGPLTHSAKSWDGKKHSLGQEGGQLGVLCVVIHEESPEKFRLLCRLEGDGGKRHILYLPSVAPDADAFNPIRVIIQQIRLGQLSSEVTNIREVIKVGAGEKGVINIRQVIRVRPRHDKSPVAAAFGGEIDYSHRWEVMGHWRRTPGIGKDRNGKYGIKGFTWVVPHVKGPEEKPLIKKIRLVSESQPSTAPPQ